MITIKLKFVTKNQFDSQVFESIKHLCSLFYTVPVTEGEGVYLYIALPSEKNQKLLLTLEFSDPFYLTKAAFIRLIKKISVNRNLCLLVNAYENNGGIKLYESGRFHLDCLKVLEFLFIKKRVPLNGFDECTTIIRFHSAGKFEFIERVLCNIKTSNLSTVYPLIVAQDLSIEQKLRLDYLLESFSFGKSLSKLRLYLDSPEKNDIRSKLLNEGLKSATTKYVAFLDYDDLITPNGYVNLILKLRKSQCIAAVGCVYSTQYSTEKFNRQSIESWNSIRSYKDLSQRGNIPLHSYMLDKSALSGKTIYYFPDMKYMEDYALNLQILKSGNTDFSLVEKGVFVGDYLQYDDLNTLSSDVERIQNLRNNPEFLKSSHYLRQIRGKLSPGGLTESIACFIKCRNSTLTRYKLD